MTLLVGNNVITGGDAIGTGNFGNLSVIQPFVALSTGTANTIYFYRVTDGGFEGTVTAMRFGIYSTAGTLLGETSELTTIPAGWLSAALTSGVSITASTSYVLAIMSDGWLGGYATSQGATTRSQAQTYGALPSSITVGGGTQESYDSLAIYADGTVGGASIVPHTMAAYAQQ